MRVVVPKTCLPSRTLKLEIIGWLLAAIGQFAAHHHKKLDSKVGLTMQYVEKILWHSYLHLISYLKMERSL